MKYKNRFLFISEVMLAFGVIRTTKNYFSELFQTVHMQTFFNEGQSLPKELSTRSDLSRSHQMMFLTTAGGGLCCQSIKIFR